MQTKRRQLLKTDHNYYIVIMTCHWGLLDWGFAYNAFIQKL